MPIKNKDGSVYRLSKPNPLVQTQKVWNSEKLLFHNKYGEGVTMPDQTPEFTSQFFEPTPEIQETIKPEEPKIEVKFEPPPPAPTETPKPKAKNIAVMYCLPAETVQKKDDLYGDSYTRNKFGQKITFEAIVISRDDLSMQFWTTYPIKKGSIVFPYKYADGSPFGEHRWWKVGYTEEVDGGTLVRTMPSEYHPDFS